MCLSHIDVPQPPPQKISGKSIYPPVRINQKHTTGPGAVGVPCWLGSRSLPLGCQHKKRPNCRVRLD